MAYSGSIEDRLLIRELVETYNDAVFRRDSQAWQDIWADDAQWHIFGQVIKGRAAIVSMWEQAMGAFSYVGFFAQPGSINVMGATATAVVYVRETIVQDGALRRVEGQYNDALIKQDGVWRYKSRIYQINFDSNAQAK